MKFDETTGWDVGFHGEGNRLNLLFAAVAHAQRIAAQQSVDWAERASDTLNANGLTLMVFGTTAVLTHDGGAAMVVKTAGPQDQVGVRVGVLAGILGKPHSRSSFDELKKISDQNVPAVKEAIDRINAAELKDLAAMERFAPTRYDGAALTAVKAAFAVRRKQFESSTQPS